MVYVIVRAGGRQEKVSVGDIVVVDRIAGDSDGNVELKPLMLVDGTTITSDASELASTKVVAEVVRDDKGPKIIIMKFKNKTGYRRRQGHRSKLTRLRVTSIG